MSNTVVKTPNRDEFLAMITAQEEFLTLLREELAETNQRIPHESDTLKKIQLKKRAWELERVTIPAKEKYIKLAREQWDINYGALQRENGVKTSLGIIKP